MNFSQMYPKSQKKNFKNIYIQTKKTNEIPLRSKKHSYNDRSSKKLRKHNEQFFKCKNLHRTCIIIMR